MGGPLVGNEAEGHVGEKLIRTVVGGKLVVEVCLAEKEEWKVETDADVKMMDEGEGEKGEMEMDRKAREKLLETKEGRQVLKEAEKWVREEMKRGGLVEMEGVERRWIRSVLEVGVQFERDWFSGR